MKKVFSILLLLTKKFSLKPWWFDREFVDLFTGKSVAPRFIAKTRTRAIYSVLSQCLLHQKKEHKKLYKMIFKNNHIFMERKALVNICFLKLSSWKVNFIILKISSINSAQNSICVFLGSHLNEKLSNTLTKSDIFPNQLKLFH